MCNPISYQILSELSDYWTELTTYGGILKVNIGFQIKRLKMCENKIKLVVALGFISLAEHGDNKHNLSDTNPKKIWHLASVSNGWSLYKTRSNLL